MSSEAYEILALLMRYVFVCIGLMIVWRSFRWLRRDTRAYHREMQALPDAGYIGEIVDLITGQAYPLPHEGTIGSSRTCDITVKGDGVARTHVRFEFEEGKGLKIIPLRHRPLLVNGVEACRVCFALHGTQLQIGENSLRVRLFAGLNVPHPAAYPEPDAILPEGVYWEPFAQPEEAWQLPPGYALENETDETEEMDAADWQSSAAPVGMPPKQYDGGYTEDGQMTWQYAYSPDELKEAMRRQSESPESGPYTAAPRRRRRRRHEE